MAAAGRAPRRCSSTSPRASASSSSASPSASAASYGHPSSAHSRGRRFPVAGERRSVRVALRHSALPRRAARRRQRDSSPTTASGASPDGASERHLGRGRDLLAVPGSQASLGARRRNRGERVQLARRLRRAPRLVEQLRGLESPRRARRSAEHRERPRRWQDGWAAGRASEHRRVLGLRPAAAVERRARLVGRGDSGGTARSRARLQNASAGLEVAVQVGVARAAPSAPHTRLCQMRAVSVLEPELLDQLQSPLCSAIAASRSPLSVVAAPRWSASVDQGSSVSPRARGELARSRRPGDRGLGDRPQAAMQLARFS